MSSSQADLGLWPRYTVEPVSGALRELYSDAVSIAVEFLNYREEERPGDPAGSVAVAADISAKAREWTADYFDDLDFCGHGAQSELTRLYPDLLNTKVDRTGTAHLAIVSEAFLCRTLC
jgi:hypothetical protein